jgi:hypothetical protein
MAPLARRSLLQRALRAVGAATILCAPLNPVIGAPKLSQRAVAYQDHPDGDKRCEKCAQFQPPNACKIVDGTVSPQGYCRFFTPIRQATYPSRAILEFSS